MPDDVTTPRGFAGAELPSSEPRYGRHLLLTAIAAFVVGVATPPLLGVRLGQRPPSAAGSVGTDPGTTAGADPALLAHQSPLTLEVRQVVTTTCADANQPKPSPHCDTPNLAHLLEDTMSQLAVCRGASRAPGVLSLGLELDFPSGRVTNVRSGGKTHLVASTRDALLGCARQALAGHTLDSVSHRHDRYTVYYVIDVAGGLDASEPAVVQRNSPRPADERTLANGFANVAWDDAVVRRRPAAEAQGVARLTRGTRVRVGPRSGPYYEVTYGKGKTGWILGAALGL
jgi:hypothetical protein